MARNFTALTDKITFPSDGDLNILGGDLSIGCWAKVNSANKGHQLVNKKDSGNFNNCPYIFHTTNEAAPLRLQFFRRNSIGLGGNNVSTIRFPIKKWVHLAVTYKVSSGQTIFYVDGNGPNVVGGTALLSATNTQPL